VKTKDVEIEETRNQAGIEIELLTIKSLSKASRGAKGIDEMSSMLSGGRSRDAAQHPGAMARRTQ